MNSQQRKKPTRNDRRPLPDTLPQIGNTPPQNLEAEGAVLGGILLRPDLMGHLVSYLLSEDFYYPAHKIIYEALLSLYAKNKPLDLITLAEILELNGELEEAGGKLYLAELASRIVSSAGAEGHAEIVKDKSIRRNLIEAAREIIAQSFGPQDTKELLDQAESSIFALAEKGIRDSYSPSGMILNPVFKQLEERVSRKEAVTGVDTGYTELNELTSGFQRSDLIIIAARPAMGKTAFALNIALNAALEHGETAIIFSLEMSKEQIMTRMLSVLSKLDMSKLRRGNIEDEDWAPLYHAADRLEHAPLYIDDTPALSPLDIRARCRRIKAEQKGLGLVIVDYLQLMQSSRYIDSREQQISDISRNLKALAKELDVPVVALSQLNRKVEERSDKRPVMSDLRESGAIEQDADVILFLYREAAYKKPEELTERDNIAEIIIGKQRNGPTGTVKLFYHRRCTSFENLTHTPVPSESFGGTGFY